MQVDAPSPGARTPPQSTSSMNNVLLEESHICWRSQEVKEAFKKLKAQRFVHTTVYGPLLLQATGMDTELAFIFQVVGWDGFWNIAEQGSKLLNLDFYAHCKLPTLGLNLVFLKKSIPLPRRI